MSFDYPTVPGITEKVTQMRNTVLDHLVTSKKENEIENFDAMLNFARMHNMLDHYPSEKKTNKVSTYSYNNL